MEDVLEASPPVQRSRNLGQDRVELLEVADARGNVGRSVSCRLDGEPLLSHSPTFRATHRAPVESPESTKEPAHHAIGRSRGGPSTKIGGLVDIRGRLLALLVAPGQGGDGAVFLHLMDQLNVT